MKTSDPRYDKDVVKAAATGQWDQIYSNLLGFDPAVLDGEHHPCPNCGGTDRFNADREKFAETGQVWCNQNCGISGDGFHVIMKLRGVEFPEAVQLVGEYLNVTPSPAAPPRGKQPAAAAPTPPPMGEQPTPTDNAPAQGEQPAAAPAVKLTKSGRKRKPRSQEEWKEILTKTMGKDRLLRQLRLTEWAKVKPGVDLDTLLQSSTHYADWYLNKDCAVFIAVTSNQKITGLQYAPVDGSMFPAFGGKKPKKTKNRGGSRDGWIVPLGTKAMVAADVIVKCEGPIDAFAIQHLLPEGWVAVTNLCGARSIPNDYVWLNGKTIFVMHDADTPGQEGASKFCKFMASRATEIRNVQLPFEIAQESGKDLRDWVAEGGTWEQLKALIDETPVVEVAGPSGGTGQSGPTAESADGENDGPVEIANYDMVEVEPEMWRAVPRSLERMSSDLSEYAEGWPKVSAGQLFVHEADKDRVRYLESTSQLFAWVGSCVGVPANYSNSGGCHTKTEFLAHLQESQERFDAIEFSPHEPPVSGVYYAHRDLPETNGKALDWLLSRFNTATELDRTLIACLFLTLCWGGQAGDRPIFLVTADGHGAGKSTLAKVAAELVDGAIDVQATEKLEVLKQRLLSQEGRKCRLAAIDNMKGFRVSNAELEAMVTASRISGKQMYVGEGSRPNLLTWILTSNSPGLSRDLAQRVVNIQLKRAEFSASWSSETYSYVREHRWEILSDIMRCLRMRREKLERHTRWSEWDSAILGRIPRSAELQQLIQDRQNELDSDHEESDDIVDFVRRKLTDVKYDTDEDSVFIPSSLMTEWYRQIAGDRSSQTKVTRAINAKINDGLITQIQVHRKEDKRGFKWIGNGDCDKPNLDLETRLAAQSRRSEGVFSSR